MAIQIGVRLQVVRAKGVIVSALCPGQGVTLLAVDAKASVQDSRSKDLWLSKLGLKVTLD